MEEQAAIIKGDIRPSVPISLERARRTYGARWEIFTPVEKAAILKGETPHAAMRRRSSDSRNATCVGVFVSLAGRCAGWWGGGLPSA